MQPWPAAERVQPQKAAPLHRTPLCEARSGALTEMCAVAHPATNRAAAVSGGMCGTCARAGRASAGLVASTPAI